MLRGEELGDLDGDPALLACRQTPVPVLSAAVSVVAAVRAARCGAGILMEGMSTPDKLARLTRAFGEAGGTGARVLIRRVWLGRVQSRLVEDQRAVYDSYAGRVRSAPIRRSHPMSRTSWPSALPQPCARPGPMHSTSVQQLPGMSPDQVREQIEQIGSMVVPSLKEALASSASL